MLLRNRTPARLLQRRRVERLHAEAHRTEAGSVEPVEQLDVEPVEPRFGFEREVEPARLDLVAELDAAIALFAEQRIAEDHVGTPHLVAQPLDLVDDVGDRPGAIAGEDAMRAVGAELRTSAAGEERKAAADRPRRPLNAEPARAALGDEIPPGKRQRIEVLNFLADGDPGRNDALRDAHDTGFGLAVQDEVAVIDKQRRHLRGGDADEPYFDSAGAHLVGPRGLALVIDQRRENQRDVPVDRLIPCPPHLVAGARQDGRQIRHVDARHVMKLFLEVSSRARDARKRIQPGSVAANNCVLADEPAIRFQICENNSHTDYLAVTSPINVICLEPPRPCRSPRECGQLPGPHVQPNVGGARGDR